ncbi:MAG: type IV toxin-antitoxin system AbiEi family antitoxin [Candidatus Riflebacteria bacterium]|nr:type IV toxin-antitoxin system AbiEi family antitoxin [Candidatus Riflebacteria bacterium]
MPRPSPVGDFVDQLQSRGKYVFRKEAVSRATPGTSRTAISQALHRLAGRGRVVHLRGGFYVIVPLEYRATGILPPSWFIGDLMRSIGQPYYVGLLSAAALHGAAHQQPQEFQVVTSKPVRRVEVRGLKVAFVTCSSTAKVPTVEKKAETGTFRVSTPAATALDLVRYSGHAGGLSNVATVLQELVEVVEPAELLATKMRDRPEHEALAHLAWSRVGGRLVTGQGAHDDEDHRHPGRQNPDRVAPVVGEEPHCVQGDLAGLPQEGQRRRTGGLRRRRGRGSLLRLDRRSREEHRRRPLRPEIHPEEARQQVVETERRPGQEDDSVGSDDPGGAGNDQPGDPRGEFVPDRRPG